MSARIIIRTSAGDVEQRLEPLGYEAELEPHGDRVNLIITGNIRIEGVVNEVYKTLVDLAELVGHELKGKYRPVAHIPPF